jgi:hypothetical protein
MSNFLRSALALALAFAIVVGLCGFGYGPIADAATFSESQKDAILKEFFGEDVTPEEAFNRLLEQTDKMEGYVNQSFQYIAGEDSYYVALGDETAAVTVRQKSSYVDKLANALDIPYKNLAAAQMRIQDVYATITDNQEDIKKADLITIGWSNYGATFRMCQYMGEKNPVKVTDEQWSDLVGSENLPLVEDLLDAMFQEIKEKNLSEFGGYDLEGGLEWYAFTYLSNALHQSVVIEEIRKLNEDAVIVLVGTYNDLEGMVLDVSGTEADLGTTMQDLVNASNLLATKNAAAFSRVAYVDATDVTTTLDSSAADLKTPKQYVLAIVGRQGLPNADGHAYIAKQIQNAISETCTHIWQEGVVTTKPTCENAGVMTYVCDWCGESYVEPIEATGHAWDDGVVTKEPTATEDGVKTYTCAHCGATRTEVIEKTGDVDVKIGDVNGDGRINARDARALLRFIAGLAEDGEVNEAAADYDNNGKVNARDARALLRSIAGLE